MRGSRRRAMANRLLETERAFLERNRAVLVRTYRDRYLVIRNDKVHGDFETLEQAVTKGAELFGAGPFLAVSPTEKEISASVPALSLGVPLTCPR